MGPCVWEESDCGRRFIYFLTPLVGNCRLNVGDLKAECGVISSFMRRVSADDSGPQRGRDRFMDIEARLEVSVGYIYVIPHGSVFDGFLTSRRSFCSHLTVIQIDIYGGRLLY